MKQNINIEAEGGELVLRNAHGDVVIIPRNKRREALGYLAKGDHSAIDAIAMELPKASDYAMGGAVYDGGEDPIEGVMGPETTIVGKRPFSVKNFLNRWGKHHAENPSDNFFGALGQGLMAPLQLAQAGATYALTGGKEIEPGAALRGSKFTNFMNKLSNSPTMDPISKAAASALGSETGQNILFDPLNIPITKGAQTFSKIKPLGITENIGSDLIRNGDVEDATKILNKIDNNSFYRQIGKEGYEDAIKTGVIRSNPIGEYAGKAPYFVEGKDFDKLYSTGAGAVGKKPEYIFEMPQLKNPEEMSAFRVNQQAGYSPYIAGSKEIPISQGKIYRLNNNNEYELIDVTKAGSDVGKLTENANKIKNKPVQNGFLFDKKGFMQQYPKGDLTEMEINAVRNTDEYKKMQSDHLKMKEKYGNNWKLGNFYEEAIQKNDRDAINRILYGGSNYNKLNYAGTAIVGYVGVGLPSVLGLLGLSTFGNKNQILNTHKKLGLYDPTDLGFLTSKDTVIDISDKKMDYAKVNENKDGKVILGGEFIEETNNSVRKVKDWINADSLDTFGDKKIKTKDINKFYGVENNKFKVGTLKDFDKETEVVPVRFKDTPIKKAVLNNKQLRLLDNDDKPIYQNTPNTGKFILHSPSSKKSIFVYINEGKKGVDEVNKFLKQNGDAFYIHLDNGRYEFYGINEDGLTKQNFENYYEQDLKRENNPGYNLIIK